MEKEKNKKEEHMLSSFFDKCKEMYSDGSKQQIGLNPLEEPVKEEIKKKSTAEDKLERIKRILLE